MPKPRSRRKDRRGSARTSPEPEAKGPSPRWVVALMCGFLLLGLLWIVLYYIVPTLPLISDLGGWNLIIGMGFITAGFITATQWR